MNEDFKNTLLSQEKLKIIAFKNLNKLRKKVINLDVYMLSHGNILCTILLYEDGRYFKRVKRIPITPQEKKLVSNLIDDLKKLNFEEIFQTQKNDGACWSTHKIDFSFNAFQVVKDSLITGS